MRYLITGGCGFIGRHLVANLLADGHEVVDVDALTYAAEVPDKRSDYQLVRVRVEDLHPSVLPDRQYDAIIHLAAETHVDNSLSGPETFVTTNVLGTLRVLNIARFLAVPRVLVMSTDEVTGPIEFGDDPTDERSLIRPSSPYSASKAAAELIALAYYRSFSVPVVVARSTNAYGPGQHPEKFIPRAITYALSHRPVPLYGDGRHVRDWIHVDDLVRALRTVLDRGQVGEVYAVGTRREKRNLDVACIVAERFERLGAKIESVADRPGHDLRYATNPAKVESLGWYPCIDFRDGLMRTCDWYAGHEPTWRAAIERGGRW